MCALLGARGAVCTTTTTTTLCALCGVFFLGFILFSFLANRYIFFSPCCEKFIDRRRSSAVRSPPPRPTSRVSSLPVSHDAPLTQTHERRERRRSALLASSTPPLSTFYFCFRDHEKKIAHLVPLFTFFRLGLQFPRRLTTTS